MRFLRLWPLVLLVTLTAAANAIGAHAAPYPTKPIHLIVPYAPGGNSDVIARILAARMSESLGQQILVENRPGASAIIGSDIVSKAAPDGYTLLIISSGNLTTNPSLFTTLPYDTLRGFTPISNVAFTTYALDVHPSLPVYSVKELIDLAKKQPGKIDAATPGIGTGGHLALELFMAMSGTSFTQVSYKGAAPALNDTISGQTKVIMDALSTSITHVRAGTIRALAQSGTVRSPLMPDVPTIAESGLPGYEYTVYNSLLGPPNLPRQIVEKLQAEIEKAGRDPEIKARFDELGITMAASSPEKLVEFMKTEMGKWSKIIRDAGIQPQ